MFVVWTQVQHLTHYSENNNDNQYLLSYYYMLGICYVFSVHFFHLILTTTQKVGTYYPCIKN